MIGAPTSPGAPSNRLPRRADCNVLSTLYIYIYTYAVYDVYAVYAIYAVYYTILYYTILYYYYYYYYYYTIPLRLSCYYH